MADEQTGTGDPSGNPSPANTPGAPVSTPAPVAAAPTAQSTGFTYKEDRSQWIPKHRFDEVSRNAARVTQLENDNRQAQARIQALAGVTPGNPDADKAEQVKAAFLQMFPQFKHLAGMTEEQAQQLTQAPQHFQRQSEQEQRQWKRHGDQQVATISEKVAQAMGAEKLSDRQTDKLRSTFGSWLKSTAAAEYRATGESATLQKYEDGDPSITEAFVKEYTEDFIAPARRQVTAQQTTRSRPVPNSGGRNQVTTIKRPESFKSLDERLDFGAKLYQERGGSFSQ